ncbi:MAG: hypothetical protein Q4C34_08270, partial [Bacteroidales bacterium]|nr:hypothetical protein [Bacteroidales bacterium]
PSSSNLFPNFALAGRICGVICHKQGFMDFRPQKQPVAGISDLSSSIFVSVSSRVEILSISLKFLSNHTINEIENLKFAVTYKF